MLTTWTLPRSVPIYNHLLWKGSWQCVILYRQVKFSKLGTFMAFVEWFLERTHWETELHLKHKWPKIWPPKLLYQKQLEVIKHNLLKLKLFTSRFLEILYFSSKPQNMFLISMELLEQCKMSSLSSEKISSFYYTIIVHVYVHCMH